MTSWRELLKPDWRRLLATALMLALLVAAYIQAFAFVDDVPGATPPPLYNVLRPFDFWVPGMLLIMPLAVASAPLQWLGVSVLASPLIWPLQVGYLYLLSCLLVFGHDHWAKTMQGRWRKLIVVLPFLLVAALWVPGMVGAIRTLPQMLAFFLSSTLLSGCVLALYTYVAACIGLAVYKRLRH